MFAGADEPDETTFLTLVKRGCGDNAIFEPHSRHSLRAQDDKSGCIWAAKADPVLVPGQVTLQDDWSCGLKGEGHDKEKTFE